MGAIQVVSCRRRQYRWDVVMMLYNADYKAMGVHEELMHSGPWRTRLLNPAVAGGGGQRQLAACVFWALLLLHARCTAELDALAVCRLEWLVDAVDFT